MKDQQPKLQGRALAEQEYKRARATRTPRPTPSEA